MPTPTIRLRMTERLSALLERVWAIAPELRDDFPATVVQALALYAEYREGRASRLGVSAIEPPQLSQPTSDINPLPKQPDTEPRSVSSDSEW